MQRAQKKKKLFWILIITIKKDAQMSKKLFSIRLGYYAGA